MNLNRGSPLNNSVDKNRLYPFIILNIHKLSLSLSLSQNQYYNLSHFLLNSLLCILNVSTTTTFFSISNHGVFQLPGIGHILFVRQAAETEVGTFSLVGDNTVCWILLLLLYFAFLFNHFILLFGYAFALESLNVKYDYNYFVLILMLSLSHNFTISVMLIYRIDCIGKNQYQLGFINSILNLTRSKCEYVSCR